jgi:hypothetical protein
LDMFNRGLFLLAIVLSISTALSSASAQEGVITEGAVPPEEAMQGDLEGAENDTAVVGDNTSVLVYADDNATGKDVVDDAGAAIDKTAPAGVNDSANESTPAGLPPEELLAEIPEEPGAALRPMTVVHAVEDLYVDLTEEKVYNDDHLVCEYLMGDLDGEEEFPGIVMVQFDISDLEMREDDVGVLALKAESVEKIGSEMAGVFLMPITSEWSESSSVTALGLNMLSIVVMISNGDELDLSQFGMNFGEDEVFAFDVSEHLKAADVGRVSFLLVAVGDTDYRVSFKSRETGEGPTLLIAPYPSTSSPKIDG